MRCSWKFKLYKSLYVSTGLFALHFQVAVGIPNKSVGTPYIIYTQAYSNIATYIIITYIKLAISC